MSEQALFKSVPVHLITKQNIFTAHTFPSVFDVNAQCALDSSVCFSKNSCNNIPLSQTFAYCFVRNRFEKVENFELLQ